MRVQRFAKSRHRGARLLSALGFRPRTEDAWVTTEEQPSRPDPLPGFRFFAILGTWMEGDVVAATVQNVLAQGCERVYLVDNASPDDTVAAARSAGAILARSFASDSYDETLRIRLMNEVVREVSDTTSADHVWWLWLDADEFHHGPGGQTLRAYLETIDRCFRIVGARVLNHFPHRKPEYLPGFHPLEFQPLCEELEVGHCPSGHWKHPLQRLDRGGPTVTCDIGFHRATCTDARLIEPTVPVFLHHFQYRDEQWTRRRLERLCLQKDTGPARIALTDERWNGSGISKRFRTLAAVYGQEWHGVANLQRAGSGLGVSPVPWHDVVGPQHANHAVWYSRRELEQALAQWQNMHGEATASG